MEWLRGMRIEAGKTLAEMAALIGVSECYLSRLETGNRRPSVTMAKKIADVLACDWTKFFSELE